MGNSIPHGDRLHECTPSCPENPNKVSISGSGVIGQRMPIKPGDVAASIAAAGHSIKDVRVPQFRLTNEPFGLTRIDRDGVHYSHGPGVGPATEDAQYALDILPDIIAQFLTKNVKYAKVEVGYDLGAKGIIPDLNRKLGILVARLWDEAPTSGEDTDEVIGDMIGHLLLMLAKMRSE